MSRVTPETAVKRAVREHLRGQGFFVFPLTAGMGSHPGISDMCAVRDGVTLWIECKSATGRLSAAQEAFRVDIEGGIYVVRGKKIAFAPSAVVWHHRRPTASGYLRQQKGYGFAESASTNLKEPP